MQFPLGHYGVIYVDRPWEYKMRSQKGEGKGPSAHYPTMKHEDFLAMRDDILFASAPDCVLVLWTSWAASDDNDLLQDSLDLIRHWGFTRKTGGSWGKVDGKGKVAMGPGYIFRSADEPFLVATRGSPRIKNHKTKNRFYTGEVPDDLSDLGISLTSLRREHSRKPDEMPILLQELFDGPYLELFSRTQRPGWTVWGNETTKFEQPS